MMSMTFTKLFSSITESTIWGEPDHVRICWITMLAMADRLGRVWGTIPGLANRARLTREQVEDALSRFHAPDKYSRTKFHEGRRVETIEGGWRLLNHAKYREIRDEEAIKESKRNYINKKRADERSDKLMKISSVDQSVENVEQSRISAEAKSDADSNLTLFPQCFEEFWEAYPRKEGKTHAARVWVTIANIAIELPKIISAISRHKKKAQWKRDDGRFIPWPAKWLEGKRWLDEEVFSARSLPGAVPATSGDPEWMPILLEVRDLLKAPEVNSQRLRELAEDLPSAGWRSLDRTTEWNVLRKIQKGELK